MLFVFFSYFYQIIIEMHFNFTRKTPSGQKLTLIIAGVTFGGTATTLSSSQSLLFDSYENVYAVDRNNSQIQKFTFKEIVVYKRIIFLYFVKNKY